MDSIMNAIETMSGASKDIISKTSSEDDILDYILIFLCQRLERIQNVYKGGYVLHKIIPDKARHTMDIDFSINSGEQYEIIKPVLKELGEDLLSKGVINKYILKNKVTPTSSGGIKFWRDNFRNMGIDIGWHDTSYGIVDWEVEGFKTKRFSVERMLSDKINCMFSDKRCRRIRDLYDIYIMHNNFDIDYKLVREFIDKRGTIDWTNNPLKEDAIVSMASAYDTLKITDEEDSNNNIKPQFKVCLNHLEAIINSIK